MKMPIFLISAVLGAAPVAAASLPPAVAAMIDAAAAKPDQLRIVAEIARKTNPGATAEIDARVAMHNRAQAASHELKLATQGVLEGWSGSGEVGGFAASGNTDNRGVAIGVNVAKVTREWKHSLRGQVDYQEDQGVKSRERYFAGYEGNYSITPDAYALQTIAYERDVFSGFSRRFAQSLGLGYKLINRSNISLALEGGAALRQTLYTSGINSNVFAARGGLNGKWLINKTLTLSQNATVYDDSSNMSVFSLTAVTAKVTGAMSARMSFQLNSESNPPPGLERVDTTSRVTLVYSF